MIRGSLEAMSLAPRSHTPSPEEMVSSTLQLKQWQHATCASRGCSESSADFLLARRADFLADLGVFRQTTCGGRSRG